MKKVISLFLSLMMLLSITAGLDLSAYAADDFTEIRTVSDLYRIRFDLDGNYILMNDIDLTAATSENGAWSFNGHGWNPIGSSDIYSNQEPFTGVFDGNGHKIIGLNITSYNPEGTHDKYIGLFGVNNGIIKNLDVCDFNISSRSASYYSGRTNCYALFIGCIAAQNNGSIVNCSSRNSTICFKRVTGAGEGSGEGGDLGGIVAINTGEIKYCNSDTTFDGDISSSSWSGSTSSNYQPACNAGGISSKNTGLVYCSKSYPTFANEYINAGGIAWGYYEQNGVVENCYSNYRIVGHHRSSMVVKTSYCTSGLPGGVATNCYYLSNGQTQTGSTPLTEEQMKMDFMYQGFDFDNIWYIDENSDYPYPQLRIPNTKTVEKITIKKQPKKTVYVTNEAIEAAEGVLNVKYIDGTIEDIPMKDDMLSGYDMATAGTQTVTVTYEDKTATFDILVKDEANIESLVIQSQPNKKTFVKGTKFDFTGCVARINYADTTYDDINITADMTSGGDINTVGTQTISYSVGGKTATFDVEVVPVVMERIVVTSAPDKVDYLPDEELDTTGLVVKAEYNNGKIKEITNYTLSGFGDTNEVNPITVSYDEKETTFNVTIHTPDEEWTTITEASCTVQGEKVKYCKTCGDVVIRNVVDPKGHTPVTDDAVAATCTKTGLTEGSHCSVCGAIITAQQVVNAKGHSYTSKITKTATCSSKGIRTYTCTTCGDTYTAELEMTAHTPVNDNAVAATCTNSGLTAGRHCSVCGYVIAAQEVVNAKGHAYTSAVTAPTCKDQGYTTYTCTTCGDSYKGDFTAVTDNHDYKGAVTTPATCTTTGIKTFTCTICGDSYTETINKIAHTPETDAAVAPTCTATGLTEGSHCSVCGAVLTAQEVINAKGHSYEGIVTAPTCKDQGYTTYTCKDCGDSYKADFTTVTDNHDYKGAITTPATCSSDGVKTFTCSICGDKYTEVIEKTGEHNYESVVTKPSTCTERGVTTFTCSVCGDKYISYISMKSHSAVTDAAVAPTCTKTGLTKGSHCRDCGAVITAQEVVNAKGHSYTSVVTAPTCKEQGYTTYTCSVCGDSYKGDFTAVTNNHNYKSTVTTPATCTAKGVKTFTCSVCGDKYTEDIEMKAHTAVTDKAVAATCTKTGLTEGSHCSVCGTVIVEQTVIPAKQHNYVPVVTAPTCRDKGYTTYTCSVCGDSYRADYTDKLTTHDYNGVVTTLPTCSAEGVKTFTCSVCGDTYTEPVAKLAHTPATDAAVAPTGTSTGLTEGSHCSVCGEVLTAQEVVPALIPEGASVAVNGDKAVITLSDGSTITVPKDTKETVANADGTYTVTLNDGSSVTVSSNAEIAKTSDGQLNVKATDNGKTTTVTVPSGSSVVKKGDNYKIVVVNGTETVEKTVAAGETVVIDKSGSMSCNGNHKYDKGVITIAPSYVAEGVKTYTCTVCGNQKIEKLAKLPKKANTLTVKAKKPTVKLAKLKKKNQTIALKKAMTVSKAQGTVTYAKASGNKKITVSKAGKITVKKGLKKGTYKVNIKVTAAGNTAYKAATKTVTVTIKVK